MTKVLNYIFGVIILGIVFIRFKLDKSFKQGCIKIETKIKNLSSRPKSIPEIILSSIISIEDRRFLDHPGVDLYAIIRAIYKTLIYKKLEGASTIEQQLVRLITNRRKVSIARKINELCLAVFVSRKYSKRKILNYYCQLYNFEESLGIHDLCLNEFDEIRNFALVEAASIVARLKYPTLTAQNYVRYLKRVRTIEILVSRTKKYQIVKNSTITSASTRTGLAIPLLF